MDRVSEGADRDLLLDNYEENEQGLPIRSAQRHTTLVEDGGIGAPGPPGLKPDHRRCIVHFDLDCFYAQVEEVLNPSLRGKAIGIQQKYLMVTCNYVARNLGVRKMKSVAEAKKCCPSLIMLDGEDLTHYREASDAIFSYISRQCGPLVQRLGMDEIFADVTEIVDGTLERSTSEDGEDSAMRGVDSAGKHQDELPSNSHRRMAEFTGHLYAPGSGGTLLEAQTGLEITLGIGNRGNGQGGVSDAVDGEHARNESHTREEKFSDRGKDAFPPRVPDVEEKRVDPQQELAVSCQDISGGSPVAGEEADSLMTLEGMAVSSGARGNSTLLYDPGAAKGTCRCGCVERLAVASAFAARVRAGLLEAIGYTCSGGIGCTKAAAKLVGELHKPAQQTTILPEHATSMILQLPLRKLPGCGHSTCAKMKGELGITETRQLLDCPWPLLVRTVGLKLATVLFLLCRGEDRTPVVPSVRPKTMSDEDSFKRGTVRSRDQVELHMRRLTAALLLRAGERVRLHRETPEILRVSFRRASKGYGNRVSRQCAISGGFAAAWGAAGDTAAGLAAATRVGGSRTRSKESGSLPTFPGPKVSGSGGCNGATVEGLKEEGSSSFPGVGPVGGNQHLVGGNIPLARDVLDGALEDTSANVTPRVWISPPCSSSVSPQPLPRLPEASNSPAARGAPSAQRRGPAAEEALSEIVRLAMTMFDKMSPPRENMDVTLLSVGLARFRSLGGVSQSGIAKTSQSGAPLSGPADTTYVRFLAPLPQPAQDSGCTNRSPAHDAASSSCQDATPPTIHLPTRTDSNGSVRQLSRDDNSDGHGQVEALALGPSNDESCPNPSELPWSSRRPADRALLSHANEGREAIICTKRGGGEGGAGTKRQRLELKENPYQSQPHQQLRAAGADSSSGQGNQDRHKGGKEEDEKPGGKEEASEAVGAGNCASSDGEAFDDGWEGAEVLVVAEGGSEVRGRGELDWCGPCRAHVLRSDVEEHFASAFHRARLRD